MDIRQCCDLRPSLNPHRYLKKIFFEVPVYLTEYTHSIIFFAIIPTIYSFAVTVELSIVLFVYQQNATVKKLTD